MVELAVESGLSRRTVIALAAMHGELASQNGKVDWSGRPEELAALCITYADAMESALGPDEADRPDAPKG
jgi:hypothetical protein